MEQINALTNPAKTDASMSSEERGMLITPVEWSKETIYQTGLGAVAVIEEIITNQPLIGERGEFGGIVAVVDDSPFVKLDEPAGDPSFTGHYAESNHLDAPTGDVVAFSIRGTRPEKISVELNTNNPLDFIDFEFDANRPSIYLDRPPLADICNHRAYSSKHMERSDDQPQGSEQAPDSLLRQHLYSDKHMDLQVEQPMDKFLLGSEEAKQRMERMELHIDPDSPISDEVIEALEAMPNQEIVIKRQRSPVLDMAAIMVATGAGQLPFPNVTHPELKPGQRYWTERELAEFDKQNQASAEALRLAEEKRQRRMQRNLRNAK
jgi:hypothetical protein